MDKTSPMLEFLYYVGGDAAAAGARVSGYLFGDSTLPARWPDPDRAAVPAPLPPPELRQSGQIRIDLGDVEPGTYRVLAVHNFHVEDRNPRLDECAAGVFLAGRIDGTRWEDPERFPVECRAVAVLGEVEVSPDGLTLTEGPSR